MNQDTLVAMCIFDSLKKSHSDYTGCTVQMWFTYSVNRTISSGIRLHLRCTILIHFKELAHKSHLFMNQTTLLTLHVVDSLNRTGS